MEEVLVGQCSMCNKVLPVKYVVKGSANIVTCVNCDIDKMVMLNVNCYLCDNEANLDFKVGIFYNGSIFIGKIACGKKCGKILVKELNDTHTDMSNLLCICGKVSVPGLVCEQCDMSFYCSQECKEKDWITHKDRCK